MDSNFKTILNNECDEIIVNKSKFIGYSFSVSNEDMAQQFIQTIKSKNKDANHNVFAYIIGTESSIQRYSDDGEPSGTAGIPILNYLRSIKITNTLIIVTRYFGGIKLGTGGLARAYSRSAKSVVDKSEVVIAKLFARVMLIFDYSILGKVENYLINKKIFVVKKDFTDKVHIIILIDNYETINIKSDLVEISSDNIDINIEKVDYYLCNNDKIFNE